MTYSYIFYLFETIISIIEPFIKIIVLQQTQKCPSVKGNSMSHITCCHNIKRIEWKERKWYGAKKAQKSGKSTRVSTATRCFYPAIFLHPHWIYRLWDFEIISSLSAHTKIFFLLPPSSTSSLKIYQMKQQTRALFQTKFLQFVTSSWATNCWVSFSCSFSSFVMQSCPNNIHWLSKGNPRKL